MKTATSFVALAALLLGSCAASAADIPGWCQYALSDAPKTAPKFERYDVKVERVAHAPHVDLNSNEHARDFRTRLREAAEEGAKSGPNFAGHYALASWGCGTGCLDWALVDLKTGKVSTDEAMFSLENNRLDFQRETEDDAYAKARHANYEFGVLLYILDRDLTAPPPSPSDGDTYLIHATATGDWMGQDGRIAFALDGGWRFYEPFAGLMAYVVDEAKPIVYDGSAWNDFVSLLSLENIPMLGVNTTADTTNKLAVKSSAVLLDNIGNGVQAKLNKHASGDTASLLFQTGYSGRAEFGLTGDDNLHCKVSPDGSAWTDAVVIDKTSGALTLAAGVKLPNGSASSPAAALNTNSGLFWDATNSGLGFSVGGSEIGYLTPTGLTISTPGTGFIFSATGEASTTFQNIVFQPGGNAPVCALRKGRGTIASPAVPNTGDTLGTVRFGGYVSSGPTFGNTAEINALVSEPTYGASALGGTMRFRLAPVGSSTLIEVARFDNENGLSMFGTNPVIDQNRGHRLRSTTISGAITPSVAGNLFHHSDAQGGVGEVSVDTGSAYRHAGQAAVKKLTSNADASYTPRADGRIVRDSAALTADRKLTLLTTNVTDGHKVEVSRRGSSGGHNRGVYQADGTTLIVNVADNASADFIYDAVAALWFQK